MAKHRTIFGSPAIGKIRPVGQHVFRCLRSGKVKVMGYAVCLVTGEGLNLQFVTSQLYKDQRGSPVDLGGRVCDLSVIDEVVDTGGVEKRHDVRALLPFAYLLHLNYIAAGSSEYDALATAEVIVPQLSWQLSSGMHTWFIPTACGVQSCGVQV